MQNFHYKREILYRVLLYNTIVHPNLRGVAGVFGALREMCLVRKAMTVPLVSKRIWRLIESIAIVVTIVIFLIYVATSPDRSQAEVEFLGVLAIIPIIIQRARQIVGDLK